MTEKVTLTQAQAKALESAVELMAGIPARVVEHHATVATWQAPLRLPLNEINLDKLIRALYVGYEVEKAPEERLKEYYDCVRLRREKALAKSMKYAPAFRDGEKNGILCTIEILDIKIPGINAPEGEDDA